MILTGGFSSLKPETMFSRFRTVIPPSADQATAVTQESIRRCTPWCQAKETFHRAAGALPKSDRINPNAVLVYDFELE